MRSTAKTVNFSIIYGISDYGLATDLGISYKEAADLIKEYNNQFPGVTSYLEKLRKSGEEKGYAVTMYGRKRILNELKSQNRNIKNFGYRAAMNTPIQGTAADIIKKAMIDVFEELKIRGLKSRLILQIHDELLIEAADDEVDEVTKLLGEKMMDAVTIAVPLVTDVHTGSSLYEAK